MKALFALLGFLSNPGNLMNPVANGSGSAPLSPFAIVTESDEPLTTESDEVLVTEAAP